MKLAIIIDVVIPVSCFKFHFKTNAAIIVEEVAFISATPASPTSVTTAIIVNIDSDSAANLTTDTHHGCGGLSEDVLIDSVSISVTLDLLDPSTPSPSMSGSISAGSTALA